MSDGMTDMMRGMGCIKHFFKGPGECPACEAERIVRNQKNPPMPATHKPNCNLFKDGREGGGNCDCVEDATEPLVVSDAQRLANDHWDKYVGPMLAVHTVTPAVITICEFHYKSAFIHGYKHAVEDGRAVSAAAAMANGALHGSHQG